MKLGAQLFSVRDKATDEESVKATFKKMKEIGYQNVQISGIAWIKPELFREYSEQFDLPIVCTHSPYDRLINDTEKLIEEHKIFGCSSIGIGSMPPKYRNDYEAVRTFMDEIQEPMKKINDAGFRLTYHNHAFEFQEMNGRLIFDMLIEDIPELNFILDTYWVTYAGYEPIKYIDKIGADRMKNIHLKDMLTAPQGPICPCGEGVIDFKPIVKHCEEIGIVNALVEQDNAPTFPDSYEQMQISFNNIRGLFGL